MEDDEKRLKRESERYNYGYSMSLRETWTDGNYERYFQKLDKELYFKLIQQKLIDSITESLESRGISTEAIKERGTQILNSGVIVTGGKMKTETLNVGTIKNITQKFLKKTG